MMVTQRALICTWFLLVGLTTSISDIISQPGQISAGAGPSLPLPPLPVNPMAVTSSSFDLLPDRIGFKLAVNYACGVTIAMETFLNESLLSKLPSMPPLPVVGGIVGGRAGPVEGVVKYINPIVLVGSTCINLGGICGKYNVNQNAMSVE